MGSALPLFKISEYILPGITANPFIQEVVTLQKITCLEIEIELTFSFQGNFSCVTENVYIWILMPMPIPISEFSNAECQNFRMALFKRR